jgi:hypothetical protein
MEQRRKPRANRLQQRMMDRHQLTVMQEAAENHHEQAQSAETLVHSIVKEQKPIQRLRVMMWTDLVQLNKTNIQQIMPMVIKSQI